MTSAVAEAEMNGQSTPKDKDRVSRHSHLEWVPVGETKVSPTAQRELRPAFVDKIARNFDPDNIGFPVVSKRDDSYWVIDGQHRIAALKAIGWGDQLVQCEVFHGLTEAEEAEEFLKRQQRVAVLPIDAFRVAITAGRLRECDIDRVVRLQGLRVGAATSVNEGTITAVAALGSIYDRGGAAILGRTLRIIRDAFGASGLSGQVINGVGLVCIRYQDELDESSAITKLGGVRAGVNGLLGRAYVLRKLTARPMAHCVAAATVEFLNSGRGGKKLADWWRKDEEENS